MNEEGMLPKSVPDVKDDEWRPRAESNRRPTV
jgi:hypothetical protein